jgi:hypothetical protein
MDKAEQISKLLLEMVAERFDKETMINSDKIEFGDSFAELLDRFIVLHIRMWKLEDAIGTAKNRDEIADFKLKIDVCFKVQRPKLTKAINAFLDVYISKNHVKAFSQENVKLYKGYK